MVCVEHHSCLLGEENGDRYAVLGKFSPDSSLISTITSDNVLKLLPNPKSNFFSSAEENHQEFAISDEFRDFCWFSRFSFNDKESKCFALASRGHPVKLFSTDFNAYFHYKPQDYNGDLAESYSLEFHPLGCLLLAGVKNQVQIFDVIHSSEPLQMLRFGTKKNKDKIGIVSSFSFNVDGRRYLVGTHLGIIALCENTDYTYFSDTEHKQGGVNQLLWLDDNTFLVGTRQDVFIRQYDIRRGLVNRFNRLALSTQKLPFAVFKNFIIAGTSDSKLQIIDMSSNTRVKEYPLSDPCGVCDLADNTLLLGS